MSTSYVHGYDPRESIRLQDQATTLEELLHADTIFPPGSRILEAGCGVGAQTIPLARKNPLADITSIDISESSLELARETIAAAGLRNVTLYRHDIFDLQFPPESFDHLFLCFVLEHLPRPVDALGILKRYLKPGGTITVIEGDHGSTCFHPDSDCARRAIQCQVELQRRAGGNADIGRSLFPLLTKAGFGEVRVSPRMVYVDASKPLLVEGFIRKTFTAMIEGVRDAALAAGLIDAETFDRGIQDLYGTTGHDGVFCYTFFKAVGMRR